MIRTRAVFAMPAHVCCAKMTQRLGDFREAAADRFGSAGDRRNIDHRLGHRRALGRLARGAAFSAARDAALDLLNRPELPRSCRPSPVLRRCVATDPVARRASRLAVPARLPPRSGLRLLDPADSESVVVHQGKHRIPQPGVRAARFGVGVSSLQVDNRTETCVNR
jgi:hypothetical protein